MPTYALLLRADPYAAVQILLCGTEGAASQTQTVTTYGGQVIAQYVLSGRYDQLLLVDFEDERALRAMILSATAHGQIVEDMRAFSPAEMDDVREVGAQVARAAAANDAATSADAS